MPDMMANRRAFPRYPVTLRAEVVELSSGAKISARTSDLSRGGCYIDTLKPFTSRSAVRVKLTQGNESFEVRAETRYVCPGLGMGLMFEEQIPARQLAILNGWRQPRNNPRKPLRSGIAALRGWRTVRFPALADG